MDETVFIPKYGNWFWWVCALVSIGLAWIELGTVAFAVTVAFGSIMFILLYIRCIRFGDQSFVLERFLLPSKEINYSDVVDIGKRIKINHWGNIYLDGMTNGNDLCQLMMNRVNENMRQGPLAAPQTQVLLNSKRMGQAVHGPDWFAIGEGILAALGALVGAYIPAILIDSNANNANPQAGAGATLIAFFFCTPYALGLGVLFFAILNTRHKSVVEPGSSRSVRIVSELLVTTLAGLVLGGLPWLVSEGLHSIGLI